jgi:nicotinamide mononucleotide transporter
MEMWGQVISPVELAGTVFGIIGVWLTVKQKIWCFPVGIANVGLYAIVFFSANLYADAGLQLVYIIVLAYGWMRWSRRMKEGFVAGRTSVMMFLLLFGLIAAFSVALGTILNTYTDASLPYLDSTLAATSLAAQWLIARKKIENWLLWIVVDVVYVGMYIYKDLFLTAFLYAVFIPLAIAGWKEWRKRISKLAD